MPTKPNLSSSQILPALTFNSCQQHDINKRQTIIAELCSNAPNNVVRDCIRLYDPHNLICRIQNLFPDTCQICNEKYCIRRTDKTFLACKVCGQEIHKECFVNLFPDGTPNYYPYNVPAIYYICGACELEVIPQEETSPTYQTQNLPSAPGTSTECQPNLSQPASSETESQAPPSLSNEDEEDDITLPKTQPETHIRENQPLSTENPESHEDSHKPKPTCRFYIKEKYKFDRIKGKE